MASTPRGVLPTDADGNTFLVLTPVLEEGEHILKPDGYAEGLKFEQTYEYPGTCNWYPETAPGWPENP